MPAYNRSVSRLRFDPFELDLATGELRKGETPIRLQPQPLKVLLLLAGRAGQLVSRDEIQKQIWTNETFVDFDQGLNYCIRQIRAALSDEADTPRFIETVPRRGYRFVANVASVAAPPERRAMLVVLPFQNLSSEPDQEYFSDGLTEEIDCAALPAEPDTSGRHRPHIRDDLQAHGQEHRHDWARAGRVVRARGERAARPTGCA
jgi:DNA-binding winged helix-turn-helix (wHTH) protein